MNPIHAIEELLHRTCIGAVAQVDTKGDLLLHFADWQAYEDIGTSTILTKERGNWSLMIESPWRLDRESAVELDWKSVCAPSTRRKSAHVFEGLRVDDIQVISPANDLKIRFDGDMTLHVLCDSEGRTEDCWYLLRPDDSSVVATRDYRLIYEAPDGK